MYAEGKLSARQLHRMKNMIKFLDHLYHGRTGAASRFRFSLLVIDLVTISFFVALSMTNATGSWITVLDYLIVAYLIADLVARSLIEKRRIAFFARPTTLADLIVILSLLAAPFVESLAFLRVLRALRLFRSFHMVRDLRARYAFFVKNESVIYAVLNLFVFVYVVSALVLILQVNSNSQINNYLDALYYTVATLTTTGFGDIVLKGNSGRLLAVVIMVVGVALFLRLIQTIFRPSQVKYMCPDCGLSEHDRDAVHCKHCGLMLKIETEGV